MGRARPSPSSTERGAACSLAMLTASALAMPTSTPPREMCPTMEGWSGEVEDTHCHHRTEVKEISQRDVSGFRHLVSFAS